MTKIIIQIIFDLIVLGICIPASCVDIKTRKVPPAYQIALGICSLAHFVVLSILEQSIQWNYLLTGLFVFAIYIAMVLIFKTGIGGADTKMTSLLAFYLGFKESIIMMVSHGIFGIGYTLYRAFFKKEKIKSIPLMPFLTAGYVTAKIFYWVSQIQIL